MTFIADNDRVPAHPVHSMVGNKVILAILVVAGLWESGHGGGRAKTGDHGTPATTKAPKIPKNKTYPVDQPSPDLAVRYAHKHCSDMFGSDGVKFSGYGCLFYCLKNDEAGLDQYFEDGFGCREKYGWGSLREYFGKCRTDYQALLDGEGYTACQRK